MNQVWQLQDTQTHLDSVFFRSFQNFRKIEFVKNIGDL